MSGGFGGLQIVVRWVKERLLSLFTQNRSVVIVNQMLVQPAGVCIPHMCKLHARTGLCLVITDHYNTTKDDIGTDFQTYIYCMYVKSTFCMKNKPLKVNKCIVWNINPIADLKTARRPEACLWQYGVK